MSFRSAKAAVSFRRCLRGAAVVLLLGVVGCQAGDGRSPTEDRPEIAFRNVASDVDYAGDEACFSCHEEAYTGYQAHGMARSFYPLTDSNRVEATAGVLLHHAASGFSYTLVEEEDGLYQEEFRRAPDGRTTHRLRRRMDYVMGSGNAARTYFTRSGGRLYELPLTWYTQAARWDFSPGYDLENGRFDRLVPDRCMACHNGYPEAVPYVEGTYTAVPEGIGCERCHGPGALHVEERLAAPEPPGDVDDTIVNPAHLPFDRRLDVCQQCHLQTTVSVLREGRAAFSFRPSEALSDHVALFVAHEPAAGATIDVVSHADRMRQSACFLGTLDADRPLECTTCHNPHEGFRDKGPAYFNDTCVGCHDAQALPAQVNAEARVDHQPAANCIACHMPRVQAEDAPHASFTDHWIRVVGDAPTPTADPDGDWLQPYFERDRGNREGQTYLGMALVVLGRQQGDPQTMATGAATLEKALAADTTRGEAYFLLGVAHQRLGNTDRAVPALERAVRLDPNVPQRLDALAQAYEADRRDPNAIARLYRRALSIQPALAQIRVNYGRFLQAQGQPEAAAAAFRAALTEEPWLAAAAFELGAVLAERGSPTDARDAFQEAIHLNPGYAEALGNLVLLRTAGPSGEVIAASGFPALTDGLAAEPDAAAIRLMPGEAEGDARFVNLPRNATIRVYTASGTLLRTLEKKSDAPLLPWNVTDEDGRPLASGLYLAHVRARDAAGNTLRTKVLRFVILRTPQAS